jgi:membrane-bound serine protease (ClpP class)
MEWFPAFAAAILGVGIAMGAIFAVAAYKALQARGMRSRMFKLEGETAVVFEDMSPGEQGYIRCFGELWRATSDYNLKKGDKVLIIRKDGDILLVEPLGKGKKR